jgi:hypothetical protein
MRSGPTARWRAGWITYHGSCWAEHPSTRHNTARARRPLPKPPDALARATTDHFTLRICDKEDKVSIYLLKPCTDPTTPPAQPRTRGCTPAAFQFWDFPPPGDKVPAGYNSPCCTQANRAGNCFPLVSPQGVLHTTPPFQLQQPLGLYATAEHQTD